MRILITGANGFIGSHVAERLAAAGHDLRLLLRRTSKLDFLAALSGYERVEGGMRDEASLARAAAGSDAVVHVAGRTAALTEAEYMAVNAEGTAALAEAARATGVKRFVFVSSLAALGPRPPGNPRPDDGGA